MADRIFVDQQDSTDAPFVAIVDVLADGSDNNVPSYYESIHKNSMWGIHPTGYVYWTDGFAPLLEAATMTLATDGSFQLDYVIRRYPAASIETVNAGFSHVARVAVATTVASGVGASLTALASTIARSTARSVATPITTTDIATIANTTTASNVDAGFSDVDRTEAIDATTSTVNAGLGGNIRTLAFSRVPLGADANLSAVSATKYTTVAASTAGAGLTHDATTVRALNVATNVNAAVTTVPTVTTTTNMFADAGLSTVITNAKATENFNGVNGTAWPAQWTTLVSGSGSSVQVQNGGGRMVSSNASYSTSAVAYLNTLSLADFNIMFDVSYAQVVEQYTNVGGRQNTPTAASNAQQTTGYYVQIFPQNGTTTMSVNKMVNSSETNISGDLASGAFSTGVAKRVRFQVQGSTLRLRVWDPAAVEPGTWLWTGTDTSITAAGRIEFTHSVGGGATSQAVTFDNIMVS